MRCADNCVLRVGGSHLLGVYASLPALAHPESQVIGKLIAPSGMLLSGWS